MTARRWLGTSARSSARWPEPAEKGLLEGVLETPAQLEERRLPLLCGVDARQDPVVQLVTEVETELAVVAPRADRRWEPEAREAVDRLAETLDEELRRHAPFLGERGAADTGKVASVHP